MSSVVLYETTFVGFGIDIDVHLSLLANDVASTCAVDSTIECAVAKVMKVICEKVVCLNVYVIGHAFQVVMSQSATDNSCMPFSVVYRIVGEIDIVWYQGYGVVLESIGGIEGTDCQRSVGNKVALNIYILESTKNPAPSLCSSFNITHETTAEFFDKFGSCSVGKDVYVELLALR